MLNISVEGNRIVVNPTFEQERKKYLKLIQEAHLLGELDEVERLQQEWLQRKEELNKRMDWL